MAEPKNIGCGAIIVKDDSILLLRKGSYWTRPGGRVEEGESIEDALIREIHEEVGIEVRLERLLDTKTFIEKGYLWTTSAYLATYISGDARNMEPEKHDEMRWFNIDAIPDNTKGYVRDSIRMYVESLGTKKIKEQ
jgi:ADP-ribose pyrophosphatase YjhB (NUDIX family)